MEISELEHSPLISLTEYRKSGKSPVEMNHLIFNNKESLECYGAIIRYGMTCRLKIGPCDELVFFYNSPAKGGPMSKKR